MGWFSRLFGFGGEEDILHLAEELERYADRYENADEDDNAALARSYAERVRKVKLYAEAKRLKAEFLAIVEKSSSGIARSHDSTYYHRDREVDTYSDDS